MWLWEISHMCSGNKRQKMAHPELEFFQMNVPEELIDKREMCLIASAGCRICLKTQNKMEGVNG